MDYTTEELSNIEKILRRVSAENLEESYVLVDLHKKTTGLLKASVQPPEEEVEDDVPTAD